MQTPPAARDVPYTLADQLLTTTNSSITKTLNIETIYSARQNLHQTLHAPLLESLHKQLWYAGRKSNISPIHHQAVLLRKIILTESPRLHLIWYDRTIYIQPLPSCLLHYEYLEKVVVPDEELYRLATGFLLSYTALIRYASDLAIAQELHLIDPSITFEKWSRFRTSILDSLADRNVHDRFEFGELRLGRLNILTRLNLQGTSYFTIHREYSSYFAGNYAVLVGLFALVSVAFSAMQVMASIPEQISGPVMETCFRFAVAALVGMCACGIVGMVVFLGLYVWNWVGIYLRRGRVRK